MRTLAALDDALFRAFWRPAGHRPPIFVTSLARGGTTALLNAFHDMPAIATHTYRDMPFVTAPVIWSRLGGRRAVARRERAHGDGLEIDLDSPEAFDEVLWRLFWPGAYGPRAIRLWEADEPAQPGLNRLRRHFAKIVALRRPQRDGAPPARYLSKNNANVARLRALPSLFPGCAIVVPLRRPAAHAASLYRQHRNFLRLQAEDDFTRRYMADIGHLEFGLLHKPIAFPGFDPGALGPDAPDYWLAYWIAAFREVAARADGCLIVTQDDLRAAPDRTMRALCAALDLPEPGLTFARYFRREPDTAPDDLFNAPLLAAANALYDDLAARAVGHAGDTA